MKRERGRERERDKLTNLLDPWRIGGGPMSLTLLYHMLAMIIAMMTTTETKTKAMRPAIVIPAMAAADNPSSVGDSVQRVTR